MISFCILLLFSICMIISSFIMVIPTTFRVFGTASAMYLISMIGFYFYFSFSTIAYVQIVMLFSGIFLLRFCRSQNINCELMLNEDKLSWKNLMKKIFLMVCFLNLWNIRFSQDFMTFNKGVFKTYNHNLAFQNINGSNLLGLIGIILGISLCVTFLLIMNKITKGAKSGRI